jgi:hypothetical protein
MNPSVCILRQNKRAISSGAAGPSVDLGGRTRGSGAAPVSRGSCTQVGFSGGRSSRSLASFSTSQIPVLQAFLIK